MNSRPSTTLCLAIVLGPTALAILALYGVEAFPYLLPSLAAAAAIFGSFYLTRSSREHPNDQQLRRFALVSLAVLTFPLTVVFSEIFAWRSQVPEIAIIGSIFLASAGAGWLIAKFLQESYQRSHRGGAWSVSLAESEALRHNLNAGFMLALILPILMVEAAEFYASGALSTEVLGRQHFVLEPFLFSGALLVVAWWVGDEFWRRSLVAGLGTTFLLSLALYRLEAPTVLNLASVPLPTLREVIPVALCVPAIAALLAWWLQIPPSNGAEGFLGGCLLGAIPAYSVGTSVVTLMVWAPTGLALLATPSAPPLFWAQVYAVDSMNIMVWTGLATVGPSVLCGSVGLARGLGRERRSERPPHPLAPGLAALTVTSALQWVLNTWILTSIAPKLENLAGTAVLPFPVVVLEWIGVVPSAMGFLAAMASLMFRMWRWKGPVPDVLAIFLGLIGLGASSLVTQIKGDSLPVFAIAGILLSSAYLMLVVARAFRVGLGGDETPYSLIVHDGLAFGLAAGAATVLFSWLPAGLALAVVFRADSNLLRQIADAGAARVEDVMLAVRQAADLWILMFGVWAFLTLGWMVAAAVYALIRAMVQSLGKARRA